MKALVDVTRARRLCKCSPCRKSKSTQVGHVRRAVNHDPKLTSPWVRRFAALEDASMRNVLEFSNPESATSLEELQLISNPAACGD